MKPFLFKITTTTGIYVFGSKSLKGAIKELLGSNPSLVLVKVEAFVTLSTDAGKELKWITCKPVVWHPMAGYDNYTLET